MHFAQHWPSGTTRFSFGRHFIIGHWVWAQRISPARHSHDWHGPRFQVSLFCGEKNHVLFMTLQFHPPRGDTNLICDALIGACGADIFSDKRWAGGTTFAGSVKLVFWRALQHRTSFLQAHWCLVVTRACRTNIRLHLLIFCRWKEITHHETPTWKGKLWC